MPARTLPLLACAAIAALSTLALGATPAQERQFIETYRKAYERRDHATLVSLLYTNGADAQALVFYRMMLGAEMGGRIEAIELADLTPDDRVRAESAQGFDGRTYRLVLPATKKLVVRTATKDREGTSSSTSEVFVGESGGRLWILVPAAAK
jgi:hypothetical protein